MNIELLDNTSAVLHSKEIINLLSTVLAENMSQPVTNQIVENYYNDMTKYINEGSAIVLGAFDGTKLIGFHWAFEINILNERRLHSSFAGVNKKYRGLGIGSSLYKRLEEICIERDIHVMEAMVTFTNLIAMNYHKKNGFTIERVKMSKRI